MGANQKVYDVYRSAGFADTGEQTAAEGYGQLIPLFGDTRQAPLLDFGCGGGEFLEYLRSQGFEQLCGIDRSQQQVERCHERGLQNVEFVNDSAVWLASHQQSFQTIVLNDVLEHIPKPEIVSTLEALRLSLRPGGQLVVKVPNAANTFGLVARYLDFTHEVAFTEHSLKQVLVAAGFVGVELTGLRTQWRPTLKRSAYWLANTAYQRLHRAIYLAAVGSDAPTILSKLLVARAFNRPATDR
ncbi:MAG: class I SAM-dependent methyltransferase [Archangium sp.]|nr:class I SAM-dependent methyltransferase [Archangium sp.]MDP3575843.1 class I SAM-dependent methyltransferase [Archangium sp.]